jgi:hypothetical protein
VLIDVSISTKLWINGLEKDFEFLKFSKLLITGIKRPYSIVLNFYFMENLVLTFPLCRVV